MQGPEVFLAKMGIELPCPVNPKRHAVLDATLRAFVNHEVYFFSDREALQRFEQDPRRYCGILTDPVNRVRFEPTVKSPRWDFMHHPYFFTSDSTLTAFKATPDSFAVRRGM